MMKPARWLVLIGAVLAAACGAGDERTAAEPVAEAPAPPSWEEMSNMAFQGILSLEVALDSGSWQGEPALPGDASRPSARLLPEFRLAGDLDGDGREEAVALLSASGGGSGSFTYLVVTASSASGPVQVAIADVGDRVQIRSGSLEDGAVILNMVQQGPGDAACCPSQKAIRRWRLSSGTLQEEPAVMAGPVGLSDLAGVSWRLLELADGALVPEGVEITLALEGDRIAGQSGCNRYFAGVESGDAPQALKIGPLAGTRMACPQELMDLEDRYQSELGAVFSFGFEPGRLRLACLRDGQPGALLFAAE